MLPHGSLAAGLPDRQFRRGQRFGGGLHRHHGFAQRLVAPRHARCPGAIRVSRPGLEAVAAHRRPGRAGRPAAPNLAAGGRPWPQHRPLIFPTSDDQQAGLVGGGAVDAGQMAVILGNSAVVNSSSSQLPATGDLDAMRLNWGPYLWMRCYNNGAQFLDRVVGPKPDWDKLGARSPRASAGLRRQRRCCPSLTRSRRWASWRRGFEWHPAEPADAGKRFRAALEALAYLIAWAVREHEAAGQNDHAHHRVRRHRPQQADVRNPGHVFSTSRWNACNRTKARRWELRSQRCRLTKTTIVVWIKSKHTSRLPTPSRCW